MGLRALVIEDNPRMAALLTRGLREEGWEVYEAHAGRAGLEAALATPVDAIVLDWMLPEMDGLAVLRALRRAGDETPVLMLTARDEIGDRVLGLDAGADDYLVKPFAFDELVARLRALVRRTRGAAANVIEIADLRVDTAAKSVCRGETAITLSAREYAVLECLAQRRGRVVSRDRLLEHVYDHAADAKSNVIDVFVAQLRRKVDRGFEPKLIHTRRGFGYVLEVRG